MNESTLALHRRIAARDMQQLTLPTLAPLPVPASLPEPVQVVTPVIVPNARVRAAKPQPSWWTRAWTVSTRFVKRHAPELARAILIIGAGIAVFDGSYYSAKAFSFVGFSAVVFALMPDALMLLASSRASRSGQDTEKRRKAYRAMLFGFVFSIYTNINASALRNDLIPAEYLAEFVKVNSVIYHAIVVIMLWFAVTIDMKVQVRQLISSGRKRPAPVRKAK